MAEIVEKGDWSKFDPVSKQVVTIKWQQDLGSRQEPYVALPYSVNDKEASGSLFIQQALADSFFKKCQKDESSNPLVSGGYKIQVDEAFQYRQNNEKTLRFLVYHNKANKPYQYRFIGDHCLFQHWKQDCSGWRSSSSAVGSHITAMSRPIKRFHW